MFRRVAIAVALAAGILVPQVAGAQSASEILQRVKAKEAKLQDFKANMVISDANKNNVSGMGEGYGDILRLQKATVCYMKPDKLRYDGYAQGIKATYIQNGYYKLVLASMIRQKTNEKNSPGKRQDTLDIGFLSSRLWTDNAVKVVGKEGPSVLKLDLKPKFGGPDKRHDVVWIDSKTLKVLRRKKFLGGGELRVSMKYSDYDTLPGGLPIATTVDMFDPHDKELGTVSYKNLTANTDLKESLFSLNTR
jgi:outer membrane lipoprotein-sorting protein